ncbi:MAG: toprim domain-containing protein, partial [Candidatus Kaiserbacteria bacterium]|nr:toprim domain-containing protein [Candidatus Kaiserbacteria bacterium]
MTRAEQFYTMQLAGTEAESYAKKRGLSAESISAWRLGYAPDGWRALLEAFVAEGFSTGELLAAGLIKEADGKPGTYYDRFRNRLMFPIHDVAGHVVGFTGRTLSADEPAKYLNSPETDLYRKSEILFGMNIAKDAIRTRGFTCLVEGQMDVLLAHQAGFTNAIALSGTALSERHLGLMKRYSENLMLVLDADAAGLKATARSASLALQAGLRVKAAQLPLGKDPADLISEDPQEFSKRIAAAKPIVEFFLGELAQRESDPHRLLRVAEGIVLPLIAAIPSPMEREHFVQAAARALGLSSEAVRESLKRLPKQPFAESAPPSAVPPKAAPRKPSELRSEQLLAVLHAYPSTLLAERVKSEYCRITEAQELPLVTLPESTLFYAEQSFGESPGEDAADELLHAFEEAVIREAYQEAVRNLRRAEGATDASAIEGAQAACAKLAARLAAFGH